MAMARLRIPATTPNLAQRAAELRALGLEGASVAIDSGRELRYLFPVAPSDVGRTYRCMLRVLPGRRPPEAYVLDPNPITLANGSRPPHIYAQACPSVMLCLWWPPQREWMPQMRLGDTYVPWTCEWLWYFEYWLATGEWIGGGQHPPHPDRSRATLAAGPRKGYQAT